MYINDLIIIAYYLSVLGYYLGVLIYMVPIPFYGLKKWAPQLMIDGVFSAILIFSYTLIMNIIKYFSSIIGADWNAFYLWSIKEIGMIAGTMTSLRLMGSALASMNLKFISSSLISPLISSLTYLLIFFITLVTLLTALRMYAPVLIAIGLLLHAVPFRLSRSAGAMIIATVIVFTIAAPLMPVFINSITPSLYQQIEYGREIVSSKIVVEDALGRNVPFAVIEIHDRKGVLLARYITSNNGEIILGPDKGIPNTTAYWSIIYGPYNYTIEIGPKQYRWFNETYCLVKLKLPDVVVLSEYSFVKLPTYSNVRIYHFNSSVITINVSKHGVSDLFIVYPENINANITVSSNATLYKEYSYGWYNISFIVRDYRFSNGITISIHFSNQVTMGPPSATEYPYINYLVRQKISSPSTLIIPITQFIYSVFIGPMVYVAILLSSSYALARLLGGAEPRIARLIITGI